MALLLLSSVLLLNAAGVHATLTTSSPAPAIAEQLGKTSQMLQRTEKLLAPLPSAAVDQAAHAMMRGEVLRLDSALAQTQKQMAAMQTAKAAKSELLAVRQAVHRFLFGTAPPLQPPQAPRSWPSCGQGTLSGGPAPRSWSYCGQGTLS